MVKQNAKQMNVCIRMQFCASQIASVVKADKNSTAIFVPMQIQSILVVSFFFWPQSTA